MLPGRAVVDPLLAGAVVAAAAQLGVQRVDNVGVDRTDLEASDEWQEMLAYIAAVRAESVGLQSRFREMSVKQLLDRRIGSRLAAFVHLREQPRPDLLGPALRMRPCRGPSRGGDPCRSADRCHRRRGRGTRRLATSRCCRAAAAFRSEDRP